MRKDFEPGRTFITNACDAELRKRGIQHMPLVSGRHCRADFGHVGKLRAKANAKSLADGSGFVVSKYRPDTSDASFTIYVVTMCRLFETTTMTEHEFLKDSKHYGVPAQS